MGVTEWKNMFMEAVEHAGDDNCLDLCWECQNANNECLFDFDEGQPRNFGTFDCDVACTGMVHEGSDEPDCLDLCSGCQDANNECLFDFDEGQPRNFDTFDCDV